MGCAPSATAAAATSPRLSLTDDKNLVDMAESDGIRAAAESTATDTRRPDVGVTDCSESKTTRVNGDLPLTKASLFCILLPFMANNDVCIYSGLAQSA